MSPPNVQHAGSRLEHKGRGVSAELRKELRLRCDAGLGPKAALVDLELELEKQHQHQKILEIPKSSVVTSLWVQLRKLQQT